MNNPLGNLSDRQLEKLVQSLIDHWVGLFHLSHYDVLWHWQDKLGEDDTLLQGMYTHAETRTDPHNLVAHIHLSRMVLKDQQYDGPQDLSRLLAHELMHIVVQDTIWLSVEDLMDTSEAPDPVKAVLRRRLERGQENLVTRLETVFQEVTVKVPGQRRRAQ